MRYQYESSYERDEDEDLAEYDTYSPYFGHDGQDSYDSYNSRIQFANPYGDSPLRAATKNNPRNLPCPTCGRANRLTPADRALHYQCDSCADLVERHIEW